MPGLKWPMRALMRSMHGSVDVAVDEGAAGRAARLPAPGEVHAGDGGRGHLVRVGVGIGDQRVLAAELEHDGLDGLGRGAHHRAPGRHAADQRHLGDAGMRGERAGRPPGRPARR